MLFLKKNLEKKEGIYSFSINDPDTQRVANFYKISPFPNYKESDNRKTILHKGNRNLLARQFKDNVGLGKNVLEVGCGTGQLSIFFALHTNNNIVALDTTISSLSLAKNFADKNNISNISFVNADIFSDIFSDEYFDFLWCNGVLHHTKNPRLGFKIIVKSLKKDGYVLIGLYNKFGRLRTIFRKYLSRIFGKRILNIFDPILKTLKFDKNEKDAWLRDQYQHPIESLHTIDEVLCWFDENNIEFISSIPSADFDYNYNDIFKKKSSGSLYSRVFNQICMIFNQLGSDGGLFLLVGKKR